jgi:DNA-binding response OmpR family regulator
VKRILYLEDNTTVQLVVAKHLKALGEVFVASNLTEGRRLLGERPFDLILSDVNLPDGNALELVIDLRKRLSSVQLPIIIVSASMDNLLRARSFQAGANDCFSMPAPWLILQNAVARMLEQPYVATSGLEAVAVTWVEGKINDDYLLFCPELNLSLRGDRLEELRDSMSERIRKAVAAGTVLPFVSGVKSTPRLVKLEQPQGPHTAMGGDLSEG